MAVLVEAISVVIRVDALQEKYPGGWDAFRHIIPNQTLCTDGELARVGFMAPEDDALFAKQLEDAGLEYLRDGMAVDLAVTDRMRGLRSICAWLQFDRVDISGKGEVVLACRLVGSQITEVAVPDYWSYERSLGLTSGVVPMEAKNLLRHENGVDVYLNALTGGEIYVGRTSA